MVGYMLSWIWIFQTWWQFFVIYVMTFLQTLLGTGCSLSIPVCFALIDQQIVGDINLWGSRKTCNVFLEVLYVDNWGIKLIGTSYSLHFRDGETSICSLILLAYRSCKRDSVVLRARVEVSWWPLHSKVTCGAALSLLRERQLPLTWLGWSLGSIPVHFQGRNLCSRSRSIQQFETQEK